MFYDFLGNYNVVFFVSSGLVCAGTCLTFVVPWLTPPDLGKYGDKQVLLSIEEDINRCHEDEKRYDMSYVDEEKLAELLTRKKGLNQLLERNRSQLDFSSVSRPCSFVLFNIVSDDHPHDISAYTSRQELAFISGTTTPLRGTPGAARRRYNDVESYMSMHSLRQSFADVTHADAPGNSECVEHIAVPLIPLETVEEVNEVERKISLQEKQPSELYTENEVKEEVNEEDKGGTEENFENLAAQGEERGSSLCFSDSGESWKSSSQSTADTIDSGYVEYADSSSSKEMLSLTSVWGDTNTHLSAHNLTDQENTELSKDRLCHSYSCSDVSELQELSYIVTNPTKTPMEISSLELIDEHSYVKSIDNPRDLNVYNNELTSLEWSPDNREDCIYKIETGNPCGPAKTDAVADDESPDILEAVNAEVKNVKDSNLEDVFSSMFEDILELEEGSIECLNSNKTNCSLENSYFYEGKYRETVV